MKNAKKLLALLLSCVMLLGIIALPANAETVTPTTYTEDFENVKTLANYGYYVAGYTAADVSVAAATDPTDANNKVIAFQAIQNKPEASLTFGTLADADTYSVSFKYYYDYKETDTAAADAGYAGFRFGPNGSDWNNVGRCFWWKNVGSTLQVNAGGVKAPTAPEAAIALPVDQWVNVSFTKVDNNTIVLTVDGATHTMAFDVNFAGKTPYLNFKSDSQHANVLMLDDLQVTKTVGGVVTNYDKQTFTDTIEGLVTESSFNDDFKLEIVQSPVTGFVTDPTDANNGCFVFSDSNASANRARILLANEELSAYYTLTGKIYLQAFNSGFHGLAFELSNRNNGNCMQIMSNRADNYYGTGADKDPGILSAMDAAKRWGVVNVVEDGDLVTNGKIVDIFNCGEWLNFELTRTGSTVALTVWTGDAKPATPTAVNEYEGLGTEPTLLSLMFNGSGKNSSVYVDDLCLTKSADVSVAGVQVTPAVAEGKYAVRFLGGLNLDAAACTAASMNVDAKYVNGDAVATLRYNADVESVYTSVLASNVTGVSESVDAKDLKSEYLFSMSIYGIPEAVSTVVFKVDISVTDGEGTYEAVTKYYQVTVIEGAVSATAITADAYNNFSA